NRGDFSNIAARLNQDRWSMHPADATASWYEAAGPPRRCGGKFAPHIRTCSSSRDEAHTGRPAAMDTIGLDLPKRESQLCTGHDDGAVEERRIRSEERRVGKE